jgi:hypothetical protein
MNSLDILFGSYSAPKEYRLYHTSGEQVRGVPSSFSDIKKAQAKAIALKKKYPTESYEIVEL